MSRSAAAFMRRMALGRKTVSIRVLALDAVASVVEYTTLSVVRQISAKSLMTGGWPATSRLSQATNTSYIRRPNRKVPTDRVRSLMTVCASSSGTLQSNLPSRSAM